jgi:ABC-2 type transport system ATP-binding protein
VTETDAVHVQGLAKSYGDVQAVRGIDFRIASGEVFALLGPNGAGKTTTVEILEGYRKRDAGDVSVLGHDPGKGERELKRRIGIVLQSTGIDLWGAKTRIRVGTRNFVPFADAVRAVVAGSRACPLPGHLRR